MRARVVVQVVAILVGAACTFLAGWRYSDASSAWQRAVRVEVDLAGVRQDDVRKVYANEGPLAFRVSVLQMRADALEPLAGNNSAAATDWTIAEQAAFALRQAAGPTTLLGQRRYDLPGGGSDLARRLADTAAARARPLPDPEAPDREGDGFAALALWISLLTGVVTGLAVVGASVRRSGAEAGRKSGRGSRRGSGQESGRGSKRRSGQEAGRESGRGSGRGSRREPRQEAGRGSGQKADRASRLEPGRGLELFAQPGAATGAQRRIASVALAVWAASVLFPLLQLYFSSQEQRYQAESARHAVQSRSAESLSSTLTEFGATAEQIAREGSVAATAREIDAVYTGEAAAARELARAEDGASVRGIAVAAVMARPPKPADGVEAGLADALASQPHDWAVLTARSVWEADKADEFGLGSNAMLAAIGLVVLLQARVQAVAQRQAIPEEARPTSRRPRGRAVGLACLGLAVAVLLWSDLRRRRGVGRMR
ncbi:hypothetical protein [Lentzea sp. NPDC003310]|uniref:hypothetical protein n=1 Tax=Lentzea sp. NPDC003310 TaxID=3154447 RepID=UPI0033A24AF9